MHGHLRHRCTPLISLDGRTLPQSGWQIKHGEDLAKTAAQIDPSPSSGYRTVVSRIEVSSSSAKKPRKSEVEEQIRETVEGGRRRIKWKKRGVPCFWRWIGSVLAFWRQSSLYINTVGSHRSSLVALVHAFMCGLLFLRTTRHASLFLLLLLLLLVASVRLSLSLCFSFALPLFPFFFFPFLSSVSSSFLPSLTDRKLRSATSLDIGVKTNNETARER